MTLIERRDAEASETRRQAAARELERYALGSDRPRTHDRYHLPDRFTLDEWRAVRLSEVVR